MFLSQSHIAKFVTSVFAFVSLTGCYPKEPAQDFTLPKLELKIAEHFEADATQNQATIETFDSAAMLTENVLSRFLEITEYANRRIDQFGSGSIHFPRYSHQKPRSKFTVIATDHMNHDEGVEMLGDVCLGEPDLTSQETIPPQSTVVIWDDRNNDKLQNDGDHFYWYYNKCEAVDQTGTITGVLAFETISGYYAFKNRSDGSNTETQTPNSSSVDVAVDLQVTNAIGETVLIKDSMFTFEEAGETTIFKIAPATNAEYAVIGYHTTGGHYTFLIKNVFISYDSAADVETISINGKYFDSAIGGLVDLKTFDNEPLTFKHASSGFIDIGGAYTATNPAMITKGTLEIIPAGNDTISFAAVGSDNTLNIKFRTDSVEKVLTDLIPVTRFTLIDMEPY